MFQNGATKNGPKRAAFGDVSNKANLIRLARDDASLVGKNQGRRLEKPSLVVQDKKPGILSQPAQRPVSVTGLRGVLNNATNSKPDGPSAKPTKQAANSRKTLNKRGTAVYKDALQPLVEAKELTSKEIKIGKTESSKGAPISHPSTTLPQQADRKEDPIPKEALKDFLVEKTIEECSVAKTDQVRADHGHGSNAGEDDCKVQDVQADGPHGTYLTSDIREHGHPAPKDPQDTVPIPHTGYDQERAPSEPEEYWDDEEYENEEDDGYNTARSHRSRGDNTTGGATTVLFPMYNQQVKRELLLAKQIVDSTRTAEDIQDEYYDTSMVAEYSDEIFYYMREQEVKSWRQKYASHMIF